MEIKDTIHHKIYNDSWMFFKKYYGIRQNDDEQWEQLVKDGDAVCEKYGNSKFVRELVLAVINELERLSKEVQGNAGTQ